jgi:hypothetical protein
MVKTLLKYNEQVYVLSCLLAGIGLYLSEHEDRIMIPKNTIALDQAIAVFVSSNCRDDASQFVNFTENDLVEAINKIKAINNLPVMNDKPHIKALVISDKTQSVVFFRSNKFKEYTVLMHPDVLQHSSENFRMLIFTAIASEHLKYDPLALKRTQDISVYLIDRLLKGIVLDQLKSLIHNEKKDSVLSLVIMAAITTVFASVLCTQIFRQVGVKKQVQDMFNLTANDTMILAPQRAIIPRDNRRFAFFPQLDGLTIKADALTPRLLLG